MQTLKKRGFIHFKIEATVTFGKPTKNIHRHVIIYFRKRMKWLILTTKEKSVPVCSLPRTKGGIFCY